MTHTAPAFIINALPSSRNLSHQNASASITMVRPVSSVAPLSRRAVLNLSCVALAAALLPPPVLAESMNEQSIRRNVGRVSLGVNKAKALLSTATEWKDALTEDDKLYVLRFIPIWLEPARVAISNVAKQQGVDVGNKGTVQTKSTAMNGHLLELRGEAKAQKKNGVIRELDEFVETGLEFLTLPGVAKFTK